MDSDLDFELWYVELLEIACRHRENIGDADVWRESYEARQSAPEAFFKEYPEHQPH